MKKLGLIVAVILFSTVGIAQVSFVIKKESYSRPDTVVLSITTSNYSTSAWTLPGGTYNKNDLNQPEITVIYNTPGKYSVTLTVDDGNGNLSKLTKPNYIYAPGILTKDTVLCSLDKISLVATGGERFLWENSTSSDSTYSTTTPQSKYYKILISQDIDYVVKMIDSVMVKIATQPYIQPNSKAYCDGDSTTIDIPTNVDSYYVTNMVFDGNSYVKGNTTKGKYTALKPYYYNKPDTLFLTYTDTFNCPWTQSMSIVGQNKISKPYLSLYDQKICPGSMTMLSVGTASIVEWFKDGVSISKMPNIEVVTPGSYVAKVMDYSKVCTVIDTAIVSYEVPKVEKITSINYLPGIGYVTSYNRNYYSSEKFALFNSYGKRIDSLDNNLKYTYGKLPIIIDTTIYKAAPTQYLKTYNNCNQSATSDTVRAVWLDVYYDFNAKGNQLDWSKYTVNKPLTYYIFRGTTPENMELLIKLPSSTLSYTDVYPPAGVMYAIGVKDDQNVGQFYSDMQFNWQAGYITSNISPEPINYKRIGVFACLQHDKMGSEIYLTAVAPKADIITWEIENIGITNISTGAKTTAMFNADGLYDVKVKTQTGSVSDSIVLKDFIHIGNPFYLALDTIYKTVSNDTLIVDIASYINNKVSFLSPEKPQWFANYSASKNVSVLKAEQLVKNQGLRDSLRIWVNPQTKDTVINFMLMSNYASSYFFDKLVAIKVTSNQNKAPKLIDTIPEQIASNGKKFNPLYLPDYISDDFTQFSKLTIDITANPYLKFSIINGYLNIEQTDGNYTGTIEAMIKVNDGALSSEFPISFTQPYLVNVPSLAPTVSFSANKMYVVPMNTVRFTTQLTSADSIYWDFGGAKQTSGTQVNPVVTFANAGKYTISLMAKNNIGKVSVVKTNYIIVTELSIIDTTICKGDSIEIAVLGSGFTSYKWNTKPEVTSEKIKVAPIKTTTYKVTMKKGLSTIVDSVTINIGKQPDLGNDTTFCEGSYLRLNPGIFTEYYWNNDNTKGLAYFDATTEGKVVVKTKDLKGCFAKDSITILSLYKKPTVSLGKDTTFCWKKKLTLNAGNSGAKYLWNTGGNSQTILADTTMTYSVTVVDSKKCENSASVKVVVLVPIIPNIGIITQSEAGFNLVAWEPENNKGITMYHVWKQTDVEGVFAIIDTIKKNELTVSIDKLSSPKSKMDSYALSTVDSACGNESHLSEVHNSIHLSCQLLSDGRVKAKWNNYFGIPFTKYIIYRAETGKPLSLYQTIDADFGVEEMTFYDDNAIGINSYYQVRFDLPKELTPINLKSDNGPFSQSLSNMAESELVSSEIVSEYDVTVNPNPAKSFTKITVPIHKNVKVTVVDLLGKKLFSKTGNGDINLDCNSLETGVYILNIEYDGVETSKRLVVTQ